MKKRHLQKITVTVEAEALDFFQAHFIKISTFLQEKMRELLPIALRQKLEKEMKLGADAEM